MTTDSGSASLEGEAGGAEPAQCPAPSHDSNAYINLGCRCDQGRRAHALARNRNRYQRALYGPQMVDSIGVVRRLRALGALGWTSTEIAAHCRFSPDYVARLRGGASKRVLMATALTVYDVYAELADRLGPSSIARRRAARVGWAPPLAWDGDTIDDPDAVPFTAVAAPVDPVAVQRAIWGDRVALGRADRVAAIRLLGGYGLGATAIAARLGMHPRQVQRLRKL